MAGYSASSFELSTGLSPFLGADSEIDLVRISADLADSSLTRTLILSVGGPDGTTRAQAAREWADVLSAHPEVASIRSGPAEGLARDVYDLYFPRRLLFLSDDPEAELPNKLGDTELRDAVRTLKRELALPGAELIARIAGADPMLVFPRLLRNFETASLSGLRVVDGQFVAGEPPTAILLVRSRHSAFDADRQADFDAFLVRTFLELDARFKGALSLERSGVHRFAAASEGMARADMGRISGASTAAILALFLVAFRSLRMAVLAFIPLAAGVITATTVALLLFDRLHAITLVFGTTLIGVCIDYPIHLFNHHTMLGSGRSAQASMRRVWSALTMGALTTVAGFVGLAWSDFPGVREIGVFAAVGVLAALVSTRVMLPPLLPPSSRASGLQLSLTRMLDRLLRTMEHHRTPLLITVLAAVVLCIVALPRISFDDDVFALNMPLDPEWVAEDERVRARVSRMDTGRFIVAIGGDEEAALQLNDAVHQRLVDARTENLIEGFRSLHAFLWSEDLQRRNHAAVSAQSDLSARVMVALESEGFRPDAFEGFTNALESEPPPPLRLEDLRRSALAEAVAPFVADLGDRVAVLTFLRGVKSPADLEQALADLDGVHYFDQQTVLSEVYGRYRARTMRLISVGLLAVFTLLHLRYRRIRWSLAAVTPALLAAGSTLALLSLAGTPIGLLHLLGLLLVLSFGVDYGIFLLECRSHSSELNAAMLSIALACSTTCFAFGLLAVSYFPALHALGITTAIGVLLSLLFAPIAAVLAGRERPIQ